MIITIFIDIIAESTIVIYLSFEKIHIYDATTLFRIKELLQLFGNYQSIINDNYTFTFHYYVDKETLMSITISDEKDNLIWDISNIVDNYGVFANILFNMKVWNFTGTTYYAGIKEITFNIPLCKYGRHFITWPDGYGYYLYTEKRKYLGRMISRLNIATWRVLA